uniref:Si:ch211-269k10.5 n=1 Tax=Paramormyrops kingsleyae TaxID=1676925 RepID=A0A3B3Q4A0_9TELE
MDTFKCDDCIVTTIPLVKGDRGQSETLTPEKFHRVFKDSYKVFRKGQPQALGTAQIVTGLLAITLFLAQIPLVPHMMHYAMPTHLFVASGIVSYAAGHSSNMCVTRISFTLNIISLFCALTILRFWIMRLCSLGPPWNFSVDKGFDMIIAIHLSLQVVVTIVLIYWESKAI